MSAVPERIGKYRVLEPIGRGGMGSVYKAHDPALDRMVAIKVMTEGAEPGTEARERFLREAQSAARLNHPNIVTVYELGEDQGEVFIVMELLEGQPLTRIITAEPPWTLGQKLGLMTQICEGLAFAHQRGVIHRDIKPGNIFVLQNGQVKILDFGIARVAASELTRTGLLMGTPNYMSPEQARGRRTDARSDIFSVGVVFYELLCGHRPFVGEDYFETMEKVRSEEPPPLAAQNPALPPALVQVVHRTLAKEPSGRYQTLDDVRQDLLPVRDGVEGEGGGDIREAVERKFAEVGRLHRLVVAAVGAAVLDDALPSAEPEASDVGLPTLLRRLDEQTDRLKALWRTVERLEPAVERGIGAFERHAYAEAVAELDAVLKEIPQHQRAREYRDRARLEQVRERTVRSIGPGRLRGDAPTAVVTPPRERPASPARAGEPVAPAGTAGAPATSSLAAGRTVADATRWVSGRHSRLVLGVVGLAAVVGGGTLLFRAPAPPSAAPPAAAAPAAAAPAAAAPAAKPPANPATRPVAPAAPSPGAAAADRPAAAAKPPAPVARLTAEQTKAVADHLELASFFRERGDRERALAEYQRALDIDPVNAEARRAVAELEAAPKAKR